MDMVPESFGKTRFFPSSSKSWYFHVYSVWLFTLSDLKTIVVPKTVFGILNALAISAIPTRRQEHNTGSDYFRLLMRLPIVAFWVWINLLPFAIDNQRQSAAILEDKYNKPWRTMPSGRMTQGQAKTLMMGLYVIAYCASLRLGGVRQCFALMALGFAYNDLNLADWSWFSRNAINALGFCCFASGALEVALSTPLLSSSEHREILKWLGIIAVIVASTVQMQDMGDQEGDRMRGRKSLPLTVGDGPARWMTAVPMVFWSAFCPLYWRLSPGTSVLVGSLGLAVAYRTLTLRGVESDRWTFRIWNIWMAHLYALPLVAGLRE